MKTLRLLVLAALWTSLGAGCDNDGDDAGTGSDRCDDVDLNLVVEAPEEESHEDVVVVHGTTAPPGNVTIGQVHVADVAATRQSFNYRSWSAQLTRGVLEAYETDGVAAIPVMVAYSVRGTPCTFQLPEADEPSVTIDVPDADVPDAE